MSYSASTSSLLKSQHFHSQHYCGRNNNKIICVVGIVVTIIFLVTTSLVVVNPSSLLFLQHHSENDVTAGTGGTDHHHRHHLSSSSSTTLKTPSEDWQDDESVDEKSHALSLKLLNKLENSDVQNNNKIINGVEKLSQSTIGSSIELKQRIQSQICSSSSRRKQVDSRTHTDKIIRIACIGDSITFGNGSHEEGFSFKKKFKKRAYAGNYPMTLQALLQDFQREQEQQLSTETKSKNKKQGNNNSTKGGKIKFDVRNFGVNGASVSRKKKKYSYRSHRQFRESLEFKPHIVIMMLGTNDCKTTLWKGGGKPFEKDYSTLIDAYHSNVLTTKIDNGDDERAQNENHGKLEENNNINNHYYHPWIILVTPPPLGNVETVFEWKFDPEILHDQVVPSIRKVVNKKKNNNHPTGLSLIDLHKMFFTRKPKRAKNGGTATVLLDENQKQQQHKSELDLETSLLMQLPGCKRRKNSSSLSIDQQQQPQQQSRFNCLFNDGVHPKKRLHDFMGNVVAKKICDL